MCLFQLLFTFCDLYATLSTSTPFLELEICVEICVELCVKICVEDSISGKICAAWNVCLEVGKNDRHKVKGRFEVV